MGVIHVVNGTRLSTAGARRWAARKAVKVSVPAWIWARAEGRAGRREGGGGGLVRRRPVSSKVSRRAVCAGVASSVGEVAPPGKTWALGKVLECVGRWRSRTSLRGLMMRRLGRVC